MTLASAVQLLAIGMIAAGGALVAWWLGLILGGVLLLLFGVGMERDDE